MPTGPTTSGPFCAWSSVARVSFATLPSYVTTSNVTWMSGWAAFQSATTLSSTAFCSGASPPPRQQYQRSSTGAPGAALVAGSLAVAGALLAPFVPPVDGTGVPVDDPPQALTTSAAIARIVPERVSRGG